MPAGLMDSGAAGAASRRSPTSARMRRDRTERVRSHHARPRASTRSCSSATRTSIYATGAVWPLADSGRTNFEQPVAVVLADDEFPHLWSPVHDDERLRADLPADHLHGPVYLDFDEGVAGVRRPAARR